MGAKQETSRQGKLLSRWARALDKCRDIRRFGRERILSLLCRMNSIL